MDDFDKFQEDYRALLREYSEFEGRSEPVFKRFDHDMQQIDQEMTQFHRRLDELELRLAHLKEGRP